MQRWIWIGLISLVATAPALAALPPHMQRQNELQAIVIHAVEQFGITRPLDSIVMTAPDAWRVTGGGCHMDMRIVDLPPPAGSEMIVGPRRFAVRSEPLVCDQVLPPSRQ